MGAGVMDGCGCGGKGWVRGFEAWWGELEGL